MAHGGSNPKKVVRAAMIGNGGIAIAKFVAWYLSGSVALLAEGVHSIADTANQGLLLLGMVLAARRNPAKYPLGRAKESYFWAFVVSLVLFFLGGAYAVYEGVNKLLHPGGELGSLIAPVVVLVVSIFLEGGTFYVAMTEFNKTRGKRSVKEAIVRAKDPTIPVVLLEDAGAMLGLTVALIAVIVTWVTGSPIADGIGSIVIGLLLCCIGAVLVYETHSLLIGEGVTPEAKQRAFDIVKETEGVDGVPQLLTMHLGPETVVVALKVRFRPGMKVEEIERVTDDIELRLRTAIPAMNKIFVEADSDYDAELDPEMRPSV